MASVIELSDLTVDYAQNLSKTAYAKQMPALQEKLRKLPGPPIRWERVRVRVIPRPVLTCGLCSVRKFLLAIGLFSWWSAKPGGTLETDARGADVS